MLNIGLLGYGTVGQGVKKILDERRVADIKKVLVRDKQKIRKVPIDPQLLTTDVQEILEDKEIDIIIELTGCENAADYMLQAMKQGKHVITANKAAVSHSMKKLEDTAAMCGVSFLYEAAVAGGIPIIKVLTENSKLNDISEVSGIVNGTTNYILSKMRQENMSYQEALTQAQNLGYAEADPSSDVQGIDARRKLRILSSIAFSVDIREEDIITRGIEEITEDDIKNLGNIKLMAKAIREKDKIIAYVFPTQVCEKGPWYTVDGALNAVSFNASNLGTLTLTGQGAGMLPTANAVLSDLMDIICGRRIAKPNLDQTHALDAKTSFFFYVRKEHEITTVNLTPKEAVALQADCVVMRTQ